MVHTEGLGESPRWELDSIYPGLESEPFRNAMTELSGQLDHLDQILDQYEAAQAVSAAAASPEDEVEAFTRFIDCYLDRMNVIATENRKLHLYVQCIVDTDSSNSLAARRLSELDPFDIRIQRQTTRFQSWLRKKSELLNQVISKSELARAHAFYLQSTAEQSRYMMSDAEEALAAELASSGLNAWFNLYTKIWSQLSVPFERNGQHEELPLAEIQNIAMLDPDGAVRERAARAEAAAWASMREPLAAALNGSKGAKIALNKRRGRMNSLHAALDEARIDPVTAARLAPNDSQRIGRALEVFQLTGTPMSALLDRAQSTLPYRVLQLALIPSDRAVLHQRIAERFDAMLAAGLLDEVASLRRTRALNADLPAMRAVGYRQAWAYLEGELGLAALREQGIAATRQLAKRQLTWLRSWPDAVTLDCLAEDLEAQATALVARHLKPGWP